jgi:predicted acyltransferase
MAELDEEQGIEAGRLALGLLRVAPPPTRGSTPVPALRAPLLLQPLAIQPRTASSQVVVVVALVAVELGWAVPGPYRSTLWASQRLESSDQDGVVIVAAEDVAASGTSVCVRCAWPTDGPMTSPRLLE